MELLALELVHYYSRQNKVPPSAAIEAIGEPMYLACTSLTASSLSRSRSAARTQTRFHWALKWLCTIMQAFE
jgi:hypothetical protein